MPLLSESGSEKASRLPHTDKSHLAVVSLYLNHACRTPSAVSSSDYREREMKSLWGNLTMGYFHVYSYSRRIDIARSCARTSGKGSTMYPTIVLFGSLLALAFLVAKTRTGRKIAEAFKGKGRQP